MTGRPLRTLPCLGSLVLLPSLLAAGCGAPDTSRPEPVAEQQAALVGSESTIYNDALHGYWNGGHSWGVPKNPLVSVSQPVQSGQQALAVDFEYKWAGLELRPGAAMDGTAYSHIRFWIHGGTTGAQQLRFFVRDGQEVASNAVSVPVQAGQWTQVSIALSSLGSPAELKGLVWQETGGSEQDPFPFYLDTITLVPAPLPPLALSVDAAAHRQPISPDIYGVDNASEALARAIRLPVRRWGGNARSRYNYLLDTTNTGEDYYFENVSLADTTPGSAADNFVEQDRSTGARTLLTVPLIGWVAKDSTSCGFDSTKVDASGVAVFPTQSSYDVYRPRCGNGLKADGVTPITSGFDKQDTSTAAGAAFVQGWVSHLVSKFGTAANGGVAYYNLDNEPSLWNSTHRDVHPAPTSYDELRDLTYSHAAAIKSADPSAKTLGPVAYGWTAYFYSALDVAGGPEWWNDPKDRGNHGNTDFVPWYLAQMRDYEALHNVRILDYLDLHFYPEASGLARRPAGNADLQALRLRSTHALWDRYYVDESWINQPVRLLPRMRDWVNQNYPGTKLAITEYNFGALDHINGALAQADVLGIFGREGLHLATLWWYHKDHQTSFEPHHPAAFAFRMYRNYDGQGGAFGDTRVKAATTDPGSLSVYAAERSGDGALTVMVINKTGGALAPPLSLGNFSAGTSAQVFRYSEAQLGAIVQEAAQPVSGNSLTVSYPARSITLLVIPRAAP
jgi:hypothetical protein